jgi:hypothetical protein
VDAAACARRSSDEGTGLGLTLDPSSRFTCAVRRRSARLPRSAGVEQGEVARCDRSSTEAARGRGPNTRISRCTRVCTYNDPAARGKKFHSFDIPTPAPLGSTAPRRGPVTQRNRPQHGAQQRFRRPHDGVVRQTAKEHAGSIDRPYAIGRIRRCQDVSVYLTMREGGYCVGFASNG